MTFEPYVGVRKGQAWDAAAVMLRDGDWVPRDLLVERMAEASSMQRSSCEAVLNEARKAGWVRQDSRLRVCATDAGQMIRSELRPARLQ